MVDYLVDSQLVKNLAIPRANFDVIKVSSRPEHAAATTEAQFRFRKFCKRTVDSPSHRFFGRMHEALNIDKKIKLITQFRQNGRDESFKPN
jgi:hypothetical protein